MVEAAQWAPNADDDPRASLDVYRDLNGGYPSFALGNLHHGPKHPAVMAKANSMGGSGLSPLRIPHSSAPPTASYGGHTPVRGGSQPPTRSRAFPGPAAPTPHAHAHHHRAGSEPPVSVPRGRHSADSTSSGSTARRVRVQTRKLSMPPSSSPTTPTALHIHQQHSSPAVFDSVAPQPQHQPLPQPHHQPSENAGLMSPGGTVSYAAADAAQASSAPPLLDNPAPPPKEPLRPPRKWVHDAARPNFLPPACGQSTPTPMYLLRDTLETVRDYREFVDTVGRIEQEYGQALAAAVKKFEGRLDAVAATPPGASPKAPPTTVTAAMRAHLSQLSTVAALYTKRPNALNSQLSQPLNNLDRRAGEATRRLGAWAKDIRGRWEEGHQFVDATRAKYDVAVREHGSAQARLRACATPEAKGTINGPNVSSEWLRLEKATAEAERIRKDRKKSYVVCVAGEGSAGGGGRDVAEGGGLGGWGEEARELYAHIQQTLLELLRHQAKEDRAHIDMLRGVLERAEKSYAVVDLVKDQDTFLDWNGSEEESHTTSTSSGGAVSTPGSTPGLSASSSATDHPSLGFDTSLPSLQCVEFIPPSWAQNETPDLDTNKRFDRNWLVNRWLLSAAELEPLDDGEGNGILISKRDELEHIRDLCAKYSSNRGFGDAEAMWEKRIGHLRDLGVLERRAAVARAEMDCMEHILGPDPRPELAHELKERAFATPSPCDACKQNVWSPIKSELSCRHCGIALHKHCQLHVDPECIGLKSRRRRLSSNNGGRIRRSMTSTALKLRRATMYEAPHGGPREVRTTPSTHMVEPLRADETLIVPFVHTETERDREAVIEALEPERQATMQLARVRFTYPAESERELSVAAGEVVCVVEPDMDGSGWVKARRGIDDGDEQGLVPCSCLSPVGASTPPTDASGKFVRGLFDFPPPTHTLGRGEIPIKRGEIYELTDEGMEFDNMWCELLVPLPDRDAETLAQASTGKGVVPKTYVEEVAM